MLFSTYPPVEFRDHRWILSRRRRSGDWPDGRRKVEARKDSSAPRGLATADRAGKRVMARRSVGVGATAARVHGLTGVEGDVRRTWAAAEGAWYAVEVAALGLGRPREPGPCAEGAASLNTGLTDARAVVGAIRNLGLAEAGRERGTALAGDAAAVRRTVRFEDGCGVFADVAACAAVLGIGRGVGAGPATAAGQCPCHRCLRRPFLRCLRRSCLRCLRSSLRRYPRRSCHRHHLCSSRRFLRFPWCLPFPHYRSCLRRRPGSRTCSTRR